MFTQSDFDAMPKYSEFDYWFYIRSEGIEIRMKLSDEVILVPQVDESILADMETLGMHISEASNILSEWEMFKKRPEYWLTLPVCYDNMKHEYEIRFVGSIFAKAVACNSSADPDKEWARCNKGLTWLRTTDFYTCPASSKYHDSCVEGLLKHTLKTMECGLDLVKTNAFSEVPIESIVISCLVHDWCKIGLYQPYMRNVKNNNTGEWEQVQAWSYNDDRTVCMGHGVSSMYLAQKYIKLTYEECLAIRWHMGEYNVAHSEDSELGQANRCYPLVQLVQFADRLSITNYC